MCNDKTLTSTRHLIIYLLLTGNVTHQDMDIQSVSSQDDESSNEMPLKSNLSLTIDGVISQVKDDSNSQQDIPEKSIDPASIPKLPENLPSEIYEMINGLKEVINDLMCEYKY